MKIKIYKTITLPVVLYGCETWSLTLREECRLRVFENRITVQIFGRAENVSQGEFYSLYHSLPENDFLLSFLPSYLRTFLLSFFSSPSFLALHPLVCFDFVNKYIFPISYFLWLRYIHFCILRPLAPRPPLVSNWYYTYCNIEQIGVSKQERSGR